MRIRSNAAVTLLFVCLISAGPCRAFSEQGGCQNPCGKPTTWDNYNAFLLRVTRPNEPGHALWKGQSDKESLDIRIDVETSDGEKTTKGVILVIGGRVMATHGSITQPGDEIDALDAAVLQQELVPRLLGRAVPDGPAKLQGTHMIDFSDEKTGIQFATPSAEGFVAPPWHVRGQVTVIAKDEVEYQLALNGAPTTGTNGKQYASNFAGRLSKVSNARIEDSMALDGWNVFDLGVHTRKEGSGTIYDYGATPAATGHKTVSDIRKKLAEQDYAGEPDPSRDFTGFWKHECDEAFGLQIMRYGNDGKYSVTFCGPGGCGDPADGHATFITKDPEYDVISENEIRMRGGDSSWDAYHRCTRDTHPILRYKDQ